MSANTKKVTMAQAINQAMESAMERDDTVIQIGEDIGDPAGGVMKVTEGLSTKFGHDRIVDAPISEAAIMGAAVGAAMVGMRPIAEIMINDFMTIALDQLVNLGAKHYYTSAGRCSVPMTVRMGISSKLTSGATHSQSLEAWLMHCPGLKIGMPATPYDAKGMTLAAIADNDPCVLMETYALYQHKAEVPVDDYIVPIGKADVKREGSDVTIISYGEALLHSLEAAATLEEQGVSAEVIDLRWLAPLDFDTVLASVGKTKRAVIVHNATEFCGPGAEISATINKKLFGKLLAPVERVAGPFTLIPVAPVLENEYFPNAEKVVAAVYSTMG